MAVAKKFGAFAGVYTPSVLTILGVIMYMRLGWVIGQAGLIATIAIVLIAHIISITTSLSISSIATDKKIKTGGIYYILSRSLGLPMGGSIGITLFIGTALSIALYIVGFTENFLGIEAISNFTGMENDINSVRIIGSIVLLSLVAIAFISTSLAIKTQFFVLGAIALSLVSIGLGFAFMDPSSIAEPIMTPASNGVPLITVFAIFFPAVTGFTAGVAMSGDLKDPKSAIPKGTMWAVATGLVVYLVLSIAIAYFVNRDVLLTDNNFLLKIAYYSPLVIAGIWGATLSSALGGILGAPRIIQAISHDKVIPKWFGKGHGGSNEPRNALIFTFIIAELGVLIGELDAIAEVVSMFYIAAYGFINLAFALESWASSDFRPSFAVNKWIGIIGFIASFGVMMQLNPVAMFASFIIMWLIYFLLKRKEIKSDFGDVWSSVWSSMVRTSITKLSEKSLEKRNWKPNILLFSGENKERPHLLEIGKLFIGKYGFLSAFDLKLKTKDQAYNFTKDEQSLDSSQQSDGVFVRQHSVNNIYDGIEQVSSTYGFAGVEPNTIFMGWARNTEDPIRFAQLLRNIYTLDQNIVLMDYDHKLKYGDKKQIDIWWRGKGQNGNLSLQLTKFLHENEEWSKAKLRLMVVNPINDDHDKLYKQAQNILSNLRIECDVRIINNQIENRSFYDIINVESVNSSLIFLGLPDVKTGEEKRFIENTNNLCKKIGTVILVRASSQFMHLEIGGIVHKKEAKVSDILVNSTKNTINLNYPKYKALEIANTDFFNSHVSNMEDLKQGPLEELIKIENTILTEFGNIIINATNDLETSLKGTKPEHYSARISATHTKTFSKINELLTSTNKTQLFDQKQVITNLIKQEVKSIEHIYKTLPKNVKVKYGIDDIQKDKNDNFDIRLYKWLCRKLVLVGKKEFSYNIKYQHLLTEKILDTNIRFLEDTLIRLGSMSSQNITDIEIYTSSLDKIFLDLYLSANKDQKVDNKQLANIKTLTTELINIAKKRMTDCIYYRENLTYILTNILNEESSFVDVNDTLNDDFNIDKSLKGIADRFSLIPDKRFRNQTMLINRVHLNIILLGFSAQLRQFTQLILKRVKVNLEKDITSIQAKYLEYLESYKENYDKSTDAEFSYNKDDISVNFDQNSAKGLINLLNRSQKNILKLLPESIEILSEESENMIGTNKQYQELDTINISVTRLIDFIIQDEFTSKIRDIIFDLPEKISSQSHYLQDHMRYMTYCIENKDSVEEDFDIFLDNEIKTIENNNKQNEDFVEDILLKIEERQRIINEKTSIYPFILSATNLKQYIKQRDNTNTKNKISILVTKANNLFRSIAANIWYQESESFILTKKFLNDDDKDYYLKSKQRKAISKIKASEEITNSLPYYYQQLFTNRQNYIPEFWVDREDAQEEFNNYLEDRKINIARALLIKGLPGSGKTHLSYYFANNTPNNNKVITISPPIGGSIDTSIFNKTVTQAFENSNANDFSNIDDNTIIIFEDIELWWQKSNEGFIVFDQIFDIINEHADRLTFIIIINSFTYSIIEKLRDLKRILSHIINLDIVDARSIEKMIWKRHKSGGFKISLGNKSEDNFHSWDFARLFSKYFKSSKGYINTAMYNWTNNIISINDKKLEVRKPITINSNLFDSLSDNELLILQSLIIHKHISAYKLSKVTDLETSFTTRKLLEMQRIGIIEEKGENIYEISPLLMPTIINVLESKKFL
ncbi:MAG: amino acid permease [Bacteroidales bacterium]|nr:amino acid permease [Bacteroidales bacterium]